MTFTSYQLVHRLHLPGFIYRNKMKWNRFSGKLESWFHPGSWFPLLVIVFLSWFCRCWQCFCIEPANWPASPFSGLSASLGPAITAGVVLCDQVALRVRSCSSKLGEPFQFKISSPFAFRTVSWPSVSFLVSKSKDKEILYLAYTFQTVIAIVDSLCWFTWPTLLDEAKGAESYPGSRSTLPWAFLPGERHSPFLTMISDSWGFFQRSK